MFLHGKFINQQGAEVEVRILTRGDNSLELVIGEDGGSVFFTDDPVETSSEVNDTFDHPGAVSAQLPRHGGECAEGRRVRVRRICGAPDLLTGLQRAV